MSRASDYRELTALCEMGVLVQMAAGRGTRYKLEDLLCGITSDNAHHAVDFGLPLGVKNYDLSRLEKAAGKKRTFG
ncbi:hypothetical protein [Limnohabitans sp.]|uniref:hypothetical protein n=1 Tax=Limnohabitans sp. TaxID=1907725 RepID=UPI0037C14594